MLTVVLWKWGDLYNAAHVNNLTRAIKRHLHVPYSVALITDDATGVDTDNLEVFPLRYIQGKLRARRLWIFSDETEVLGPTLLQIDLDMVITDDITSLVSNFMDSNFYVWKSPMACRYSFGLNPSFMMLRTGYYDRIWRDFMRNPDLRLALANRNGWPASDQAIISHEFTTITAPTVAEPTCPVWTTDDGIISMREELFDVTKSPQSYIHTPLPPHTRLVSFHGRYDPSQFTMLDWVRQYWLGEDINVPTSVPASPASSV